MTETDLALDATARQLIGQSFGAVRVINAGGDLDADPDGRPIVKISLVVSDPPEGEGTWPLADVDELQHRAKKLLAELDPELPYAVVELLPVTPDPPEDDAADYP